MVAQLGTGQHARERGMVADARHLGGDDPPRVVHEFGVRHLRLFLLARVRGSCPVTLAAVELLHIAIWVADALRMHRAHAGGERAVVHVRQLTRLLARAFGRRQSAVAQHVREAEVAHHLVRAARSPHHGRHAVCEDGTDRDVEGVRDGNGGPVRRAARETDRDGVFARAQARLKGPHEELRPLAGLQFQ